MAQQQDDSDSVSKPIGESISVTFDRDPQFEAQRITTTISSSSDPSLSRSFSASSRLNAQAPEFIPGNSSISSPLASTRITKRIQVYTAPNPAPIRVSVPVMMPVQNHHHPYSPHSPVPLHNSLQHRSGVVGVGGYSNVDHHLQEASLTPQPVVVDLHHLSIQENDLSQEATQKILNQVEYYFSNVNLATTEHLMRFINKDPNGYVPISVVASFKKIKALVNNNCQLASILQNSTKLLVSEDGKKVRRQQPLTGSDMEELQSRIVVAENLPEDHCHQNLMKIFSTVGSVKTIRTCQPQTSNSGGHSATRTPKADGMLASNKLHAFVEYESVEFAEKAVMELNDADNWINGLKVRLLLRRSSKPGQARTKKVGSGDANTQEDESTKKITKEDDATTSEQLQPKEKHSEDRCLQSDDKSNDNTGEEQGIDKEVVNKKGRGLGWGKGHGRLQCSHRHNTRRGHVGSSPSNNSVNLEQITMSKQPPGPRMPDGTQGFSMGRGKPCC